MHSVIVNRSEAMKKKTFNFSDLGGLVYSTDVGRICPMCRQPIAGCTCNSIVVPTGDGIVRVSRESKGRGGKAVTLVKGVLLNTDELGALCKRLKTLCGSGGTVKEGVIEVQGVHCDKIISWLQTQGFSVKRAGG